MGGTRWYEMRYTEWISVAAASKGVGLSMVEIVVGYDKKGPGLYFINTDGERTSGHMLCGVWLSLLYVGYRYDLTDKQDYDHDQDMRFTIMKLRKHLILLKIKMFENITLYINFKPYNKAL
jgi:hypothetical protein